MSAIRKRDTRPEWRVRRALHALGLRYRLHARDLPGTPDVVFRRQKVAVFVHGCFWHQHRGCRYLKRPKSNQDYWLPKLERNVERDRKAARQLRKAGWKVVVIWECQAEDARKLARGVKRVLKALGKD